MNGGNFAAFPIPKSDLAGSHDAEYGLSKREYFAAMAMQGLLAHYGNDDSRIADWAISEADALLAELAK